MGLEKHPEQDSQVEIRRQNRLKHAHVQRTILGHLGQAEATEGRRVVRGVTADQETPATPVAAGALLEEQDRSGGEVVVNAHPVEDPAAVKVEAEVAPRPADVHTPPHEGIVNRDDEPLQAADGGQLFPDRPRRPKCASRTENTPSGQFWRKSPTSRRRNQSELSFTTTMLGLLEKLRLALRYDCSSQSTESILHGESPQTRIC